MTTRQALHGTAAQRTRSSPRGRQTVAAAAVAAGVIVGAAALIGSDAPAHLRALVVVGVDASTSSVRSTLCADLSRITEVAAGRGESVQMRVLASGDERSAYQPSTVGDVVLERSVRTLESGAGRDRQVARAREQMAALCKKIPERSVSPVFTTIATAVAYLRNLNCASEQMHCEVWVRTDGDERIDPVVRGALRGKTPKAGRTPRIDNTNIAVHICGLAERHVAKGGRAPPSLSRVEAALRPEFVAPELVTFGAACAPFSQEGK